MRVKVAGMVAEYDPTTREWHHLNGLPHYAMMYEDILSAWWKELPEAYVEWLPDD